MDQRKVYFVSLGCPKNQVDTEVMLGVVRDGGHRVVDSAEEADTLVVNTCGFIEAAKEESIETILELAQAKKDSDKKLVVAGCLSQRYPTELAAEMPEVDHFLGSADMLGLAKVLGGGGKRLGVSALSKRAYIYDHTTPRELTNVRHSAYVKIAEGCDRPCGFCIIPKLRGAQRSRDVFSIVQEVHGLVEAGTREICLVAQDLTRYGSDLQTKTTLEMLLDALCEVHGLEWIRLHYAYPSAVTDGLIERIAGQPKIATYLDVPMQHADTNVLKKMRRGYTESVVRDLTRKLRDAKTSAGQRLWLRTTMLVGHPGESEEAYQRLKDFVAEGELDHLGVFPWSREEGTTSAMHPGRIDEAVAQARAAELMAMQEEIRAARHASMIGQQIRVMVDGPNADSEFLLDGRHEGQAPEIDGKVVLTDGTANRGDFVTATITQASAHDLIASMDAEAAAEAIDRAQAEA
ncbi:MAG: 30S ribosomal protein S12 methylthiotransferase RimO [Myxococcota bacterium]